MLRPLREDNIREYLTAFADGELDAVGIIAVIDHLAAHPESLRLMRDQQRLRLAARRLVLVETPPASAELQARVQRMAAAARRGGGGGRLRAWLSRLRWPFHAVLALLLLATGLSGWYVARPTQTAPRDVEVSAPTPTPVVPASLVATASRVHADCSRLAAGLHAAGFPPEQSELAERVKHDLASTSPYPDLSAIGFELVGAGPCAAPLAGTIHVLYRTRGHAPSATLSIFVQRYRGQYPALLHRIYTASVAESPFPMLVWRTQEVLYFLLGDDASTLTTARDALRAKLKI